MKKKMILLIATVFFGLWYKYQHAYFDEFPKGEYKRVSYYVVNVLRYFIPHSVFESQVKEKRALKSKYDASYIMDRVNYYCKVNDCFDIKNLKFNINNFHMRDNKKWLIFGVYYWDTFEFLRYFKDNMQFGYVPGDNILIPNVPSLLKSRPIDGDNKNAVVLKMEKLRHFQFVEDEKKFEDKKNMLVWRGGVYQTHRQRFMEVAMKINICDVGQTNKSEEHPDWQKKGMSIREQLEYKFLFCIEGNDVATSLKWMMSSNSLVFMQKPKYETWFMEGRLVPNHHFVLIKDDCSDLEEKIKYYSEHTDEGLKIIKNAHEYVEQFKDQEREDLISLFVLEKYFKLSGQLKNNE
jgi:hypothetical protein